MRWTCDHETPGHYTALKEAAAGALRRCPNCGAEAMRRKAWYEWSPPSAAWVEQQMAAVRAAGVAECESDRIEGDWSKPRLIPWLHPNHPNYRVTSEREALTVCKVWGIDPAKGGFISEKHQARALAAAHANRGAAFERLTAAQKAQVRSARQRSRTGAPPQKG